MRVITTNNFFSSSSFKEKLNYMVSQTSRSLSKEELEKLIENYKKLRDEDNIQKWNLRESK